MATETQGTTVSFTRRLRRLGPTWLAGAIAAGGRRGRVERLIADVVALEVALFDTAYGETEHAAGVDLGDVGDALGVGR